MNRDTLPRSGSVAYFSMDVAVDSKIPTYSGGLGVLAGDMLRSAADLEVPMIAVSLIHRKGYFEQRLDPQGNQMESPADWTPETYLERLSPTVSVAIEGREVRVSAWQYVFVGITGHSVPLIFLDTDLQENSPADRGLTDFLYGGDQRYRLCQEAILGLGGVAMLRAPFGARDSRSLGRTRRREFRKMLVRTRNRGGSPTLRVYNTHAGAGRTRSVPNRLSLSSSR